MCTDCNEKGIESLQEVNRLYEDSIAHDFLENMDSSTYVLGEGAETNAVLGKLGHQEPVKGISIVENRKIIATGLKPTDLSSFVHARNCKYVVCPKSDGSLFYEFSSMLDHVAKENIIILSTPLRLAEMEGRQMRVEVNNGLLNSHLSGFYRITTSHGGKAIYRVNFV